MAEVLISEDERQAALALAPGERLASAQALIVLARRGVRYGHLPQALAALPDLEGPLELVVAAAEPAVPPQDARIAMPLGDMARDVDVLPAPGGELAFAVPPVPIAVQAGEVVAEKVAAMPGRPGRSVTGKALGEAPPAPREAALRVGPGASRTPCGQRAIALIAGNASLEAGVVVVRPELRVGGDLDFAAGDVVFDGNVLVMGDVEPGRAIEATGDVTVLGVVVGARIVAGGRLVVHGGVRHEASLQAGSDVLAQFIETSTVRAGRRVLVREDLTQARVEAAWAVYVGGCRVGGQVQAYEHVEAREIGSQAAALTRVSVVPPPPPPDPRPALVRERQELGMTLAQVGIRVEEAQRVVARTGTACQKGLDAAEMLEKLTDLHRGLEANHQALTARIAEAAAHELPTVRPTLLARDRLHAGVVIQLGHGLLRAETEYPASALSEADGAVHVTPVAREIGAARP